MPESVPKPSSPSKLLRSSKAEELLEEPRRSLASIFNLPVPRMAVFRRDPFRFLLTICCWAAAIARDLCGLGGGSGADQVGEDDLLPWSLLELDLKNENDERLPERLFR